MVSLGEGGLCPSTGIYSSKWDDNPPIFPSDPNLSLPQFLLSAHSPPAKAAFIDAVSGEALSYGDLRALVAAVSGELRRLGVRKGDVVLVVSPNSVHFAGIALGVMSIGAVFSTANFLHTRQEMAAQVQDSNPVLIITTADLRPQLDGLIPRPLLFIAPFLASLRPLSASLPPSISQDDAATIMYSSGTTGKSKGVVSTHRNLITMGCSLRHVWGPSAEVYACVVPLFHMFGFSVFICGALAAGSTVVVMRRYSFEDVLMAVEEHRVTRLPAVPAMVVQLARSARTAQGYDLRSLKEVICSGAPLGRDHMARFADAYPAITLSQCYGLTETSGPITLCDGVKGRVHASIGRLIPSVEAKIVDVRTGRSLPHNKSGELHVRGPPVMKGYLKNKEATSLTIDGQGWLRTGDLCFIDARGLVYVVDRIKELIKYKAYQVAPAELEELLSDHPDVLDVAVIPYPNEEAGEIPMACIVKKSGSIIMENDIIFYMENKVAPYKKIKRVVFVDFIPRSPSGKILRRHLRATHVHPQRLEVPARL